MENVNDQIDLEYMIEIDEPLTSNCFNTLTKYDVDEQYQPLKDKEPCQAIQNF